MDLRYLEYIVEIANQHSISRAADTLFITQSNLSQYLSRLEEELGTKLFDRKRNDMTLTMAGPSALPQNGIMLAVEELLLAIPKVHVESLNLLLHYIEGEFPTVDIRALAREPFIFSQSGTTIRKLENLCFSSKHISPNIIAEINSHPASLFMVEEQMGATFVPVSCATVSDKIQYAHVSPSVQWFVAIAFRKGFIPRHSEEYFIQLAQKFYNDSSDDIRTPEP